MKIKNTHSLLSISIGLVYLWFGMLKFFPDLSPAEGLAKNTIHSITLGMVPDDISIVLLAIWETIIGFFLIFGLLRRTAVVLALVHMVFTFAPLLIFPSETFNKTPFYLTLLGQYIIKNFVIIAALLVLYQAEVSRIGSGQTSNPFGLKVNLQKFLPRIWTSAAKNAQLPTD